MSEGHYGPPTGSGQQFAAPPAPPEYGQPVQMHRSPEWMEGSKAAQASLIFAIVGIFFLGVVFGPLAIIKAKRAEELNTAATAGKVVGWIVTILSYLGVLAAGLFFGIMASAAASYGG